jgi:hypothetical protein
VSSGVNGALMPLYRVSAMFCCHVIAHTVNVTYQLSEVDLSSLRTAARLCQSITPLQQVVLLSPRTF